MRKSMRTVLNTIAKNNGYSDKFELLRDYSFIPTVLTPKHRRIELVKLLYDYITKN